MIAIKKISIEHLDMLCSLENELFDQNTFVINRRTFKYHITKGNILIGVFDNETLVGYALVFIYKTSARLYSIGIKSNYQKKGHGHTLMNRIFDIVKGRKIKKITLEAREDNYRAINIYKNFGFQECDKLEKYYPDGINGIKMELCLE